MTLTVLGIESSCDDTSAAILRLSDAAPVIMSNVVWGQTGLHAAFGGVVPEIAARAHAERLDLCIEAALAAAGIGLRDLDGIAVTAGPGLVGGLLAGIMCARGLSRAAGLPLVGVNHLAGHALTPRLTDGLPYPYLLLLVSGGHCQFLIVHGDDHFERLGGTIDDAPGEAFDKVAKLLALPQPGGPEIERIAASGDATRIPLPRPLLDRDGCDMSFSGLKTAVLRARDRLMVPSGGLRSTDRADLAAAFQAAIRDILVTKATVALRRYGGLMPARPAFAVAGGVAANGAIRAGLKQLCADSGVQFFAPPVALCTDNAAMIAFAGGLQLARGATNGDTILARPRWPLDALAPAMLGSGRRGSKA